MEDRKKKLIAIGSVGVGVVALAIGGYQAWLRVPPNMPEDVAQVEALFDSARYQRLSAQDKRPYQERINEMWGKLTPEERDRLRKYLESNPDAQQ